MANLRYVWSIFLLMRTFLHAASQETGDVRLMNGGQSSRGRVEVYDGSIWTTVCDDYWDNVDAMVVCRQLGYDTEGALARYSAFYGMGTGYISLDNVMCFGQEAKLVRCSSSQRISNCGHSEDAGVDCAPKEGDVRLVNGLTLDEGRVEVYHDQQWGTICDSRWDDLDATVICRQVGFPSDHARAVYDAYFGRGIGAIALNDVRCSGRESDLLSCLLSPWYPRSCTHSDDAGVICGQFRGQINSGSTQTSSLLASTLSVAGFIMIIATVVIIIHLRRNNLSSPCLSRLRRFGQHLRNPRSRGEGEQSNAEGAPSPRPPEYPLTVQLNNNDQQPIYPPSMGPPTHITNISLSVNFENQQILLYPPDGHVMSPPPYSPSDPEPGSTPSGLVMSPPPYSASDEPLDNPPEEQFSGEHQVASEQMGQNVVSQNSLEPLSGRRASSYEESGAMSSNLDSPSYDPTSYQRPSYYDRSHPLSFNPESVIESDDDDDDDYILPPTPHRNSVVPLDNCTIPISTDRHNVQRTNPHRNSVTSIDGRSIPPISPRQGIPLGHFDRLHSLSFNSESVIESSDDDDDDYILPPTPHRNSVVNLQNPIMSPSVGEDRISSSNYHRSSVVPEVDIPQSTPHRDSAVPLGDETTPPHTRHRSSVVPCGGSSMPPSTHHSILPIDEQTFPPTISPHRSSIVSFSGHNHSTLTPRQISTIPPYSPHRNSMVPFDDQIIPPTSPHRNSMAPFDDQTILPTSPHRNSMVPFDDQTIPPTSPHRNSMVPFDDQTIPPTSPHRNSIGLLDIPTSQQSPRSDEEPPPYSPWSISTFV